MIRCPACGAPDLCEIAPCTNCTYTPPRIDGFLAWAPELARSNAGFKAEYFDDLARLEAGNFWFRARNELILWAMRRYLPEPRTMMEIGCGTGFVLSALARAYPAAQLCGSEVFVNGLAHAARRVPNAHCIQMDARVIPYEDEFDAIAACDVLEHIDEDEVVLRQIGKALRRDGAALLTVPQHPWLWSPSDAYACHVRRYRRGELEGKMVAAGFEIERSTSFVALLLPLLLLSRKVGDCQGEFDPLAEFRIGRAANAALGAAMAVERQLIRLGVDFPAGGSRLVIARKVRG